MGRGWGVMGNTHGCVYACFELGIYIHCTYKHKSYMDVHTVCVCACACVYVHVHVCMCVVGGT